MLKPEQLPDANRLSYGPLPGSKKVYVQGKIYPDIRVPFREIVLSDTKDHTASHANRPVRLYDTSGPYTDPSVQCGYYPRVAAASFKMDFRAR